MAAIVPLKVSKRDIGKSSARQLRRQGYVPGVFYFHGEESMPIYADPLDLRSIVYTSTTRIINLEIDGEEDHRECVLKDMAFHPLTDNLVHFDLMGVKRGEKLSVKVPVVLRGTPEGAKVGGITYTTIRSLRVYCLPKDLPEYIDVDISHLGMGDSVYLGDVMPDNVEYDYAPDSVVCSVVQPRVLEEETTAEEEELEEGEEGAEEGEEGAEEGGEE